MRGTFRTLTDVIRMVGLALVAAAVYQELSKPPEKRTWHGKIADFVPYDFRLPTAARIRQRFWNPDDPRILTEHVFGVGWAINFHTLLRKLPSGGADSDISEPDND
jgi:hypothetical protein